jgi:hypothetical protein
MTTRNSEVLASFVAYCESHPEERFWQALRNWTRYSLILAVPVGDGYLSDGDGFRYDTFHWEGKDG